MSTDTTDDKKEVYLEADREIPGQHYVCLSFISPNKVLKNKDLFYFRKFLTDYEVQYKIKATESFVMKQVLKVQSASSKVQDVLENLMLKKDGLTVEDISGALTEVKSMRAGLTTGAMSDLEEHVKAEMRDFKESTLLDAYETFVFKNKKKIEDEFFAENNFRTTVQGLKVRGSYDTYNEALARAKTLQKLDPSFNVYVGQVGFWLPWDPEPMDIANQEYADDQLNTLMKKYKENETERDEFYTKTKSDRMGPIKPKGVVGPSALGVSGGPTTEAPPTDMFAGQDDVFMARKKEQAASANTISHS
jgi:hypothetical protein